MNSIKPSLSEIYLHYKDWVRKNPQTVSEVETTVKWLSYFIAGKINKSVVLTELIYSASNLLVLFNDIIIHSAKQNVNSYSDKIKIWLTVLEYSEVFIEISSKSLWGDTGKWIVIVSVQLLKCTARLMLLLYYEEKIISCPPVLPCKRNQEKGVEGCRNANGIQSINNIAFCLKRSGRIIRKVDSAPSSNNRLWKPPALLSYNNNNNNNNLEQPDKALLKQHLIGEVLYILKPVINLAFILKYGQSTWKPWMVSAGLDLISLYLVSKRRNQMHSKFSPNQTLELSRRRLILLLYLLRSPFYEKHSKDKINTFLNSLSQNLPLAKLICTPILQYLPHWQETYFYLWSS